MTSIKQLLLVVLIAIGSLYTNAQNVGIGTTNPPYKLTVQTPKTSNNWGIIHTDSNIVLGSFIYSLTRGGIAEFGTKTNNPFYLFANNTDFPPAIAIEKNGVNVGIGNETPAYNLDIHSAGNAQFNLQEGIGQHTALFSRYTNRLEIQPSDAFEVSVGGIDQRNLCIANNGYVGIGNSTPVNKFEIGTASGFSGNDLAIGNNGKAMSFYQAAAASTWYSNTNFAIMPNSGNGYVGIGTTTPSTKLEVLTASGYGIIHTDGTVRVGTYVGSGGGWFGTQTNHPLYFFTNNSNALMTLSTNGFLGIGTITPANKLQIGSIGSSGFGSNDIAFGNGTQASAIAQTATTAWWYSNTNIALMPMGNGHGRVGINTTTPIAPLEVDDYVTFTTAPNAYFYDGTPTNGNPGGSFQSGDGLIAPNVSIFAASNVSAQEFDAHSDARIKNIEDISNSAKDLETLNGIQVTDYTMKDKVKNGNRPFKKVIAQQVEEVYPQVVNRSVNYIPNVYQLTDKIEKITSGYLLSFKTAHNIGKEAKKLQLIEKSGAQQRYDIVSIPSEKEVLINATDLKNDTVFVYGEEVNDFRTVDYDGLTTLNISATQELSKLVKQQQEEIDALTKEVNELKATHK